MKDSLSLIILRKTKLETEWSAFVQNGHQIRPESLSLTQASGHKLIMSLLRKQVPVTLLRNQGWLTGSNNM